MNPAPDGAGLSPVALAKADRPSLPTVPVESMVGPGRRPGRAQDSRGEPDPESDPVSTRI
jgi:hypothetical protein